MFWFAGIGLLASLVASGVSILFALPAAVYALSWLVSLAWAPAARLGHWFAALAVLIVWGPTLYMVELALGFDMPFVLAVLFALMLLPWIGALASTQADRRWGPVAGVLGAAALLAVIIAALAPSRSEARPQALNLSYFLNATDGQARLLAGSAERALPQELRANFAPEMVLPGDRVESWTMPAAVEQIPAPVLEHVVVTQEGGERRVRARLAMNDAYRVTVRIPLSAQPLRVRVNDAEAVFADTGGEPRGFMSVACQGRACAGAEIEIVLGADGADDWFIIGQTPGLHVAAAEGLRARRPVETTPIQFGDSAISLTRLRPGG
jgi:hypothetical protein